MSVPNPRPAGSIRRVDATIPPTTLGLRTPDKQCSVISQIMAVSDEARLTAIEKGKKVYIGFADSSHPVDDTTYVEITRRKSRTGCF